MGRRDSRSLRNRTGWGLSARPNTANPSQDCPHFCVHRLGSNCGSPRNPHGPHSLASTCLATLWEVIHSAGNGSFQLRKMPSPSWLPVHSKCHTSLFSIIKICLYIYPQDFFRSWDLENMKILRNFLLLTMSDSEVTLHVNRFLTQLENRHPNESEPSGDGTWGDD